MNTHKTYQNGVTLIELMVVLAVVAIVSITAVPAMNRFIIINELSNAQDDVASILRKAKNLARNQNTNISVKFTNNNSQVALLHTGTTISTINLQKVIVHPSTTNLTYNFLSLGTVNTGEIQIVSTRDPTRSKQVVVNSLFGQIVLK